ncbi:hypothetical protein SLEP1_g45056 [Rubroshorea leprosula]|uniref:Terpene synthase N-terminal domain-containing protein n=1 Tax=Rubroshorea leprosula TaxID=152421 RepID=A0AAV5LIL6_9ROSI|nr:hypothetical protein SLEP1_g45056 [Rubroshorea leprosula]
MNISPPQMRCTAIRPLFGGVHDDNGVRNSDHLTQALKAWNQIIGTRGPVLLQKICHINVYQMKMSPFTSMALPLQASVPVAAISSRLPFPSSRTKRYAPSRVTALKLSNELTMRRSADYKPPIWSFEDIQSLKVDYVEESFRRHVNKLKEDVIVMLEEKEMDKVPLQQLELIDTLQRLGLSYHFENEINRILEKVYTNNQGYYYGFERESLYVVALEFRILRQHGYKVPQGNQSQIFLCCKFIKRLIDGKLLKSCISLQRY